MRYPFTAFSTMFLIVASTIFYTGFSPRPPLSDLSDTAAEKSHIKMVNPPIVNPFENVLETPVIEKEVAKKIEPEPEPPKATYPDWERVVYGNKVYGKDKQGFYHDREGRVWKPMIVHTSAYTWLDDGVNPRTGAGDGRTSTNKNAKTTYGIAHANGCGVVRYGQTFHISGYGIFKVDDACGKAREVWREKRKILLDIRIPNRRYDGVWRSNRDIRRIALRHEVKRNRMVLVLVKDS